MKKIIHNFLVSKYFNKYIYLIINGLNIVLNRPILKIKKYNKSIYEIFELGNIHYFVQHSNRLFLFSRGFISRQNRLLEEYVFNNIVVPVTNKKLLLVDVGANIGELSFFAQSKGFYYLAFEPDPNVLECLVKNVNIFMNGVNFHIEDVALGNINGHIQFYLATELADSSIVKPINQNLEEVIVPVKKLDSYDLASFGIPFILKIEAEGFEEGVILGSLNKIKDFKYIVVDCGPENGMNNTMPECLNLIMDMDFKVIEINLKRGVVMFENLVEFSYD